MCSPAALEGGDVEGVSRAVENDYSCTAYEDDVYYNTSDEGLCPNANVKRILI